MAVNVDPDATEFEREIREAIARILFQNATKIAEAQHQTVTGMDVWVYGVRGSEDVRVSTSVSRNSYPNEENFSVGEWMVSLSTSPEFDGPEDYEVRLEDDYYRENLAERAYIRLPDMERVSMSHVYDLITSAKLDAVMVRWHDTGEVEVMAGVLFGDISYEDRNRPHEVIASRDELNQTGDHDTDDPADADCDSIAAMLNGDLDVR